MFGFAQAGGAQRPGAAATRARQGERERGTARAFDKTQLCKFFAKGRCKRGPACAFAHSDRELRQRPDFYKTQLCIDFFRQGMCPLGAGCRYAHSTEEIRRTNVPRQGAGATPADSPQQLHASLTAAVAAPETCGARPAAPPGRPSEAQLDKLQAEIAALQARLRALESPPPAPLVVADDTASESDIDEDLKECANGWSRQSTGEPALDDTAFSDDGCGTWCGDFDYQAAVGDEEHFGAEAVGVEVEEAVPCDLTEKNTFLCLSPSAPAMTRRAGSAPPAQPRR